MTFLVFDSTLLPVCLEFELVLDPELCFGLVSTTLLGLTYGSTLLEFVLFFELDLEPCLSNDEFLVFYFLNG
jgi:hypothetical protein